MFARQQIESGGRHAFAEACGVPLQPRAEFARALHQVERGERSGHDRRCERVREEVGARSLPQQLDDLGASGDVAAGGAAEGFAERARDDVDAVLHTEQLGRARAALADEAHSVRVVDHHHRAVLIRKVADLRERSVIAVHREDSVGDDQDPSCTLRLPQPRLQLLHVAVRVAMARSLRQPHAIDDRCVVEGVRDHSVVGAEDRLEQSAVRVVAGGVEDRGLLAEERRQPGFQLQMLGLRAADEPHGRHPEAPLIERGLRGLDDAVVVCQPQVVVRAEVQHFAAVSGDQCALRAHDRSLVLGEAVGLDLVELRSKLLSDRLHGPTSRIPG